MKNDKNRKLRENTVYESVSEPALPMLLLAVCSVIALIAFVLDKFVFPFSDNLLAPMIVQLIAIAIPCYLAIMLLYPDAKPKVVTKELKLRKIESRYIFFIIFTVPFMACVSLLFAVLLGDIPPVSEGFALLGTFAVGQNDFSVSAPYLILCYALVPSVLYEILLRGIVLERVSKISQSLGVFICVASGALLSFELSLASLLAALAVGLILVFVLYTTESLTACMVVHFLFNLYRIFLEGNIAKYYAAAYNNTLFILVFLAALLIFGALFASECARIYRENARSVAARERKSKPLDISLKALRVDLARAFSFKPTLICSIVFAVAFIGVAVIGILT
jgi:membrane protease YdiL (CAAX protease family)